MKYMKVSAKEREEILVNRTRQRAKRKPKKIKEKKEKEVWEF